MKSNHNNISFVTHFSRAACLVLLLFTFSCKKFVEVDPPVSSIVSSSAFSNNASAAAVVTGIYSNLMATGGFAGGASSVALLTGLMGDELDNYSTAIYHGQFYTNAVAPTSTLFWSEIYRQIYTCNLSIERLQTSTGITENMRQQLMGEVKLMRAFFYFYLVNLFGDVPLSVTSDYRINNALPRTPKATVYQQITTDLEEARNLLTPEYRSPAGAVATDRLRPNKYAAMALLARTYLYLQDWKKAEAMADSVISRNGTYILEADLTKVFQRSSREIIWQLQPTALNQILWEPQSFVIAAGSAPGPIVPTAISPRLKNTFETGDPRFTNWVGVSNVAATGTLPARTFYFPYKYKAFTPNIEGMVVFRLAEMFLIRAEARAQQGMLTGNNSAVADLNTIRARAAGATAGVLPPITVTSKEEILAAIAHERQVELFTEWGNRWFDLKRTGLADAVMSIVSPQKAGTWNTDWQLLPIPQTEIIANPKLEQNNGYPK
jgi:hypothetical protein